MQLARQGQEPLMLEEDQAGGLLHNAHWVENYPGFPEGISGPALVEKFLSQADRIGIHVTPGKVTSLSWIGDDFLIETNQEPWRAEVVVVATGTEAKQLHGVPVQQGVEESIYYEIVPIADEREKEIVILGAGDAALDYALNLAGQNHVSILNRGIEIKGLSLLWERVKQQPAIDYYQNRRVMAVRRSRDGRLEVDSESRGDRKVFLCDYLVPAIGRRPVVSFVDDRVRREAQSLSARGKLFFVGDVKNGYFRQTAIAVGDGIKAAMAIGQSVHGG